MSTVKELNSFNQDDEQNSSTELNFNEKQIFTNLQSKLNNVKDRLDKIINYSQALDNNKQLDYIQKLSEFNNSVNNLEALSLDLYNEYIVQCDDNILSEVDRNEQKKIKINKKVYNIFLPYMLYLQILLSNNS